MTYKLEDFKTGDEVYFNRDSVDNYDLYWKVIGFESGMIKVSISEMGQKNELYIDVQDIVRLQTTTRKNEQ